MPSHSDRVRRNYLCSTCDGAGRLDDYEGSYVCYKCDGAGVILTPKQPPRPSTGRSFAAADWLMREGLTQLVAGAQTVRAMYDTVHDGAGPMLGQTIDVRLPERYR